MNVGDWIKKSSQITPNKIAIIDDGCEFSYREFNERCNKVSNFFLQKGIGKGDRVVLLAYNSHEYMEIYFAAGTTGIPKGAILSTRKTFFNALNANIFLT